MDIPEPDGHLTDMNAWTREIGLAMAEVDGYELGDTK